MSEETCDCGSTKFEFNKFGNVWQLICINCKTVIVPIVHDNVKRKMEIAMTNSVDEIKKFYPKESNEIIDMKIELENMAFKVDNK